MGEGFKNRLTEELTEAIDTVCFACPYRVDVCEERNVEYSDKYCDRCMVQLMYRLFAAERDAGGYLPDDAPEWQAIINY